ncbi:transcriptional regulator GlxA family with amidase domain [Streptacidiphilus sp. BW17]
MSRVSRNTATGDEVAVAPPVGAAGSAGPAALPRKLSGRRRPEIVAVLLFSGGPIFESSIPLSVFGVDRQDTSLPHYRLLVCAGEPGPLATTGGLTMTAPHGIEGLARAGTVVVPAWRAAAQTPPPEALAALRKAHAEGARIIGLCTGAFVLAAAGLLDGRPATTHWMYAPTLAKRYPQIQVDPRELYIDEGDVLTSAGTAAGIDLCLHVVRTDHGADAAAALARRLVVPVRRTGGQAPYVDRSLPEEIGNDPLAEVVTWALENLSKQFDVEVLAARAYMSRRTFDRRFRSLTGSAPLQWLISQRVLQAQRLLETTELSVDEVARRCGFRSPVALRGHFRRQLGVSPAVYRSTFRARRPETPTGSTSGGTGLAVAGITPSTSAAHLAGLAAGPLGSLPNVDGVGSGGPTVPPQGGPGGHATRSNGRARQGARPAPDDHSSPAEDGRPGPSQGLSHPDGANAALRRRAAERP